jgi:hypothetical protein
MSQREVSKERRASPQESEYDGGVEEGMEPHEERPGVRLNRWAEGLQKNRPAKPRRELPTRESGGLSRFTSTPRRVKTIVLLQ